jgi:excisionase family DNA binding protein
MEVRRTMNYPQDRLADTIPQAAARLSISRTRIFEEIRAGRLKAVRAGGRTLIPREAQAEWLASLPRIAADIFAAH